MLDCATPRRATRTTVHTRLRFSAGTRNGCCTRCPVSGPEAAGTSRHVSSARLGEVGLMRGDMLIDLPVRVDVEYRAVSSTDFAEKLGAHSTAAGRLRQAPLAADAPGVVIPAYLAERFALSGQLRRVRTLVQATPPSALPGWTSVSVPVQAVPRMTAHVPPAAPESPAHAGVRPLAEKRGGSTPIGARSVPDTSARTWARLPSVAWASTQHRPKKAVPQFLGELRACGRRPRPRDQRLPCPQGGASRCGDVRTGISRVPATPALRSKRFPARRRS